MQKTSAIYLDYNATTPVDPVVVEAMLPYFTTNFANAASNSHFPGKIIRDTVAAARTEMAENLDCEPGELIFTSGATESINLAIKGVAEIYASKGNHIITWATEHKAVLDSCKSLSKKGLEITVLPVDREGKPDLTELEKAIRPTTILICMMLANNETGVIMPVEEVAAIAHKSGVLFFCDATQAPGKMRLQIPETGADLLCISAHKFYGPKGIGALYIKRKQPRVYLAPLLDGGGHENGLRSGTLNVPGIIGMSKALTLANERYWDDTTNYSRLRTLLEQIVTYNEIGFVNGSLKDRLPNTSNICFHGIKAASLLSALPNLALATGSACSSALPEPSHVLTALGLTESEAYASVRFSLGRYTTEAEIMEAAMALRENILRLKSED
ncbi:MAG: cysteine desulfurase [Bacteroidetes bacterium]|nr:cysteine desulfurase [Bacteroidota bacterium]